MKKPWCVSNSDSLVKQVREKYNLSKKAARKVINKSRELDPSLQLDNITLDYLEGTDAFKKAISSYISDVVENTDILFQDALGADRVESFKEQLEDELSIRYPAERVSSILQQYDSMDSTMKNSKVSTNRVLKIVRAFKDPRRMDFVGGFVCRQLSYYITQVSSDPELRAMIGVEKQNSRLDYCRNNNVITAIKYQIQSDLAERAEALRSAGNNELAEELETVSDWKLLNTLMYMYGRDTFMDEGIPIAPFGTITFSEEDSDSDERNDTENPEGEQDQDTTAGVSFTSQRNQSVSAKILPEIKILLRNLREKDSSQNDKTDKYGYGLPVYVSTREATQQILSVCKGCTTFAEQLEALNNNVRTTPWMSGLIKALDEQYVTDENGKTQSVGQKRKLQSMFFRSAYKVFTPSRISVMKRDVNGDVFVENIDVNVGHKGQRMYRNVVNKFFQKANLPIFDRSTGDIKFSAFDEMQKRLANNGKVKSLMAEAYSAARQNAQELTAKQSHDTRYRDANRKLDEAEKELTGILKGLGVDVSDKVMGSFLSNSETAKQYSSSFWGSDLEVGDEGLAVRYQKLDALVRYTRDVVNEFISWGKFIKQNKGNVVDTPATNPFIRRKTNSQYSDIRKIPAAYDNLIDFLTEFSPDSFEQYYHVNSKGYYSWNNPSSIERIVNALTGKDRDKAMKYIEEKYGKDKVWFVKPSDDGQLHFYSDILEEIYHGRGAEYLEYSEKVAFGDSDYSGMSDFEYELSMLSDYFDTIEKGRRLKGDRCNYRMLIASDKPRYSSIAYKKYTDRSKNEDGSYSENNYHNIIARKAVDFFAQELRRSIDVIDSAVNGEDVRFDNYDIDTEKFSAVITKIRNGENVTFRDVVKNGKYIFSGTGASFYLNRFIVKEIENNSKLGKFVIDRIFNYKKNKGKNLLTPSAIDLFINGEKDGDKMVGGFHNDMKDRLERYYDKLDELGFYDTKVVVLEGDQGEKFSQVHARFLIGNLQHWHRNDQGNFSDKVFSRVDEAQALADREAEKTGRERIDLRKDQTLKQFFCELAQFREDLEEYIYNSWLAKVNMMEIFDVDPAYYGNTTNFQKRQAQIISAGETADRDAKIHDETVSDGKYRSITVVLGKNQDKSRHINNFRKLFSDAAKLITDEKQRRQFEKEAKSTLEGLGRFDSTDGQSITGLTGLRKRMAGQGTWTVSDEESLDEIGYEMVGSEKRYIFTHEAVYRRALRGETIPEDLLFVFNQTQKPFVYSMPTVTRKNGRTMSFPVQHKNSEFAAIFLQTLSLTNAAPKSQMEAIAKFLEESAKNHPQKGIDVIHFKSVVKVGANSKVIDIGGKTPQKTLEALREAVYGETKDPSKDYQRGYVTEYDVQDYKIVQTKPEHFKHSRQQKGSQQRILSISNISDDAEIKLPNGKTITGRELKDRYFNALSRKMIGYEEEFRRNLGLDLPKAQRLHKLSMALKNAMKNDVKFDAEMRNSLSIITRNGTEQFAIPLDDTGLQSSVEAMLYSKLRNVYYKEKVNGGIVVQATSWGASEDLHIRFWSSRPEDAARGGVCASKDEYAEEYFGKPKDKLTKEQLDSAELDAAYDKYLNEYQGDYAYFEMEIPMPDHVRNMLMNQDGTIDKKYFNEDGSWNMEEVKKKVPSSAFDAIAYRIPTECKYSMMAGRVVRFSSEAAGSNCKYPLEVVFFSGSDFDIDTTTVEIRPYEGQDYSQEDNEIFDLQFAALRHIGSVQETFRSGDFSDLSEMSYYTTVLASGRYTKEQVDAMTPNQLKAACTEIEDMDMTDVNTDGVLFRQNTDANDMIAIAAVGVVSHAFISLYNNEFDTNIDHKTRIHISDEGKNYQSFLVVNDRDKRNETRMQVGVNGWAVLDPVYDMDGNLVSSEIGKYVGASADAAKDAALYRLGINTTTLPLLALMHRLGISSDVARLFFAQPVVREVINRVRNKTPFSKSVSLSDACDELAETIGDKDMWSEVKESSTKTLKYSDLLNNIANPKEQTAENKLCLLSVLQTLSTLSRSVRNLDTFSRYNSTNAMRGSSFMTRFVRRKSIDKLAENLNAGDKAVIQLPSNIKISDEFTNDEFGRLCTMFPYVAKCIIGEQELTESTMLEFMHTYSPAFFDAVNRVFGDDASDYSNEEALKQLYSGWKNYLMFVGDSRIADFHNKAVAEYYTKQFADVYNRKIAELSQDDEIYEKYIKDNSFLDSISTRESDANYTFFRYLATDSVALRGTDVERYKSDWAILLQNPKTRQLAIDTAIHFLARSAAFSPNTPVHLMPEEIKRAIPNYIEVYENADKIMANNDEIEKFIVAFCRNNANNYAIVPSFYNRRRTKNPIVVEQAKDDNGKDIPGISKISFSKEDTSMKSMLRKTDEDALTFRMPIIKVDDVLYVVDPSEPISIDEANPNMFYILAAETTPLGIQNQMSEYTAIDQVDSIFQKQENETDDRTVQPADPYGDNLPSSAPVVYSEVTSLEPDVLVDGTKIGTFFESDPYGDELTDERYEKAYTRDVNTKDGNSYLESRTYLRRAERIASLFGFRVSTAQRMSYKGYSISLAPTSKLEQDLHTSAKEAAAVISSLGYNSAYPSVKTYTKNISEANTVEFTIPLKSVTGYEKFLNDIMDRLQDPTINYDKKELVVNLAVYDDAVREAREELSEILPIFEEIKSKGINASDKIEVNYAIYDFINPKEKDQILTNIISRENGQESSRKNRRDAERSRDIRDGYEVGIGDLSELARRRERGERVDGDIRRLFGEVRQPLASSNVSYKSSLLTESVISSLQGTDVLTEVENIVEERSQTGKRTEDRLLDNVIINVANWILGNRPRDILIESFTNKGVPVEVSEEFISTIDDKLKELNIC